MAEVHLLTPAPLQRRRSGHFTAAAVWLGAWLGGWLVPASVLAAPPTASPAAPPTAAATPQPGATWSLTWAPAPLTVGIVELAAERRFGSSAGVRGVLAVGHGTTGLWSTRDIRGLTMIEGRWVGQAGAQARRYLLGDFNTGIWGAVDLRFLTIRRPAQSVFGAGLGLLAGGKWRIAMGFTAEIGVGGAVVLSALVQNGSERRIVSWSLQPTVQGALGWSF